MPKPYPFPIKNQAIKLRRSGLSYNEIATVINIAKSTAYEWTKDIELRGDKRIILKKKAELTKNNLSLGSKTKKKQRDKLINVIKDDANEMLNDINFNKSTNRLLCSFLFWAEGNKDTTTIRFSNSDPNMIKVFLHLLRTSFSIDESKLNALVHIHSYHNNDEIKKFWSSVTKIPLKQFYKSYKKPHTGKRKKPDYKGCLTIYYHNYKIALKLKHIYNAYAKFYRGVV